MEHVEHLVSLFTVQNLLPRQQPHSKLDIKQYNPVPRNPWAVRMASKASHSPLRLSSLGLNLNRATNCHSGVSQARRGIDVCAVPRTGCPVYYNELLHVKYPMVCFAKSRRAIADTMQKLQIPALTYMGHCISGLSPLLPLSQ